MLPARLTSRRRASDGRIPLLQPERMIDRFTKMHHKSWMGLSSAEGPSSAKLFLWRSSSRSRTKLAVRRRVAARHHKALALSGLAAEHHPGLDASPSAPSLFMELSPRIVRHYWHSAPTALSSCYRRPWFCSRLPPHFRSQRIVPHDSPASCSLFLLGQSPCWQLWRSCTESRPKQAVVA